MHLFTRREFTKIALTALPVAGALSAVSMRGASSGPAPRRQKPDSRFAGVQIGLNVPYSLGNPLMSGDDIIKHCVQLGLSAVELRAQPVESFLGVPAELVRRKNAVPVGPGATAMIEALRQWRRSVSMERVREFRQKFDDAGVRIEILKVDGIFAMADDIIDYTFAMAKALGAKAVSTEISHNESDLKRLGSFADEHRLMVGYHGHASTTPAHWEHAFSLAKYNGANVDLGHFVAGNNQPPVAFIKKHSARITHVHLKDRKMQNGPNMPFGEGDTPLAETLRLLRDNAWDIQATIEFEYKIPPGSDRMKELARTIAFCRDALV